MVTVTEPPTATGTSCGIPQRRASLAWASTIFALQVGLGRLGYGLALPAIRHDLRSGFAVYGAINTASLCGYLIGALVAPLLLRRVPRLVMWASLAAGGALAGSALADAVVWLGIMRTVFGVACGVTLVAATVETLDSVAAARRGAASAALWAGAGVGLVGSRRRPRGCRRARRIGDRRP